MSLQLHGNIKNYDFVRSVETKSEVEIQDSVSHEVLYKKIRQTSTAAYCSQIIDPIIEVLLVAIEGRNSKDKFKKVLLYQPDDTLELKDTGILGFEHKFVWEGESYVWRRRSLGFSREIECKMVHGDDPGIGVAIFKPGKKTIGHMTIMYFNLERIGVNDKRGLEYVLLITMFSFLDKLEDENLGKKGNSMVKEESSEVKKSEKKKKQSKKEQAEEKLSKEREARERELERIRLAEEETRRRELERKDEQTLREMEARQQELLRKLKQEKEDQKIARRLWEEERLRSHHYSEDRNNSSPDLRFFSEDQQRPRINNLHDSLYSEHQMPYSSSTNSRYVTATVYSPGETNYSDNPTPIISENSVTPVAPPQKRPKKKPKEYKNEYGW